MTRSSLVAMMAPMALLGALLAAQEAAKGPPAARIRKLDGLGSPLEVHQVPESSGRDHFDSHSYLVCDLRAKEALLIDAGTRSAPEALRRAAELGLRVSLLVSTHFHGDHTGGNRLVLEKTAAKMAASAKEAPLLTGEALTAADRKKLLVHPTPRVDLKLKHGDELKLGEHALKVIEVAGHTPGSICLHLPAEKLLFSGDVLFQGSIGRTDLPHGAKTPETLASAARARLLSLPDDTHVLPGHGPATTIGAERATNPWLAPPRKEEKKPEKGKAAPKAKASKG